MLVVAVEPEKLVLVQEDLVVAVLVVEIEVDLLLYLPQQQLLEELILEVELAVQPTLLV